MGTSLQVRPGADTGFLERHRALCALLVFAVLVVVGIAIGQVLGMLVVQLIRTALGVITGDGSS